MNHTSTTIVCRLLAFACVCVALLSLGAWLTASPIAKHEEKARLAFFQEIAPDLHLTPADFGTTQQLTLETIPVTVYPIIRKGKTLANFLEFSTHQGYNGEIRLLMGVASNHHQILGIRVIRHQETPGLGDKIDSRKSPWILSFNNASLHTHRFALKKDGGDFDSFTGASITPRAIVHLTHQVLNAWQNIHP